MSPRGGKYEPVFDVSEHLPPLSGETVFGDAKPVALDAGCGEGEFLLELSRRMPDFNHLGVEVKGRRFAKAAEAARKSGAENLKLIWMDIVIAAGLFAPGSFDRVYINFPDPWPKDRHAKHRMVNAEFLSLLGSVIRPGGGLEIASDHGEYTARARELLDSRPEFRRRPDGAGGVPGGRPETRFEGIWKKLGKKILLLRYEAAGAEIDKTAARQVCYEPAAGGGKSET